MEDKILDDDDIIDLTDLLEEGQSPQDKETSETKGATQASANEPDSFDLGKEISMEYDVSVDEIEHGDDKLDIDASLSSNEEEALSREKALEDDTIQLDDTGEGLESALDDDESLEGIDLTVDEQDIIQLDDKEDTYSVSDKDLEAASSSLELDTETPEEVSADESFAAAKEEEATDKVETFAMEQESHAAFETGEELRAETETEEELPQLDTDEVIRELKQEIPNMIEGVVRPLMAELVKEIISVSRDQLPGIVEKVIREEIDKLKKLDS